MAINDTSLDGSSNAPSVNTDLLDYAPGSTAVVTASNFIAGSTIIFQVSHVLDAGLDGQYGTSDDVLDAEKDGSGAGHQPWSVTDGARITLPGLDGVVGTADDVIAGDLDGEANGTVVTNWYVSPDDSTGARFLVMASDQASGQVATHSFTDAGPAPTVDLTSAGGSGTINGAKFSNAQFKAGTGLLDSFLRVQHNGTEQGYNTDRSPLPFDDKSGTKSLLLTDVPIAFIGGTAYREFRLDINETNNTPLLSLDALKIYLGNGPALNHVGASTFNGFGSNAVLAYDMDAL